MFAANHVTSRQTPLPPACSAPIDDRMNAATRRRLERGLRVAAAAGALILHYQPRLCLATGKVVATEALIRWPDRGQGLIPPSIFIPIAERSDLINLIGAWVLVEACKEASYWNGIRLSVNVSARQLQSGVLPIQLAMAFEQSGLSPDRLELELTDSLLVDSSTDTLLALSAIRDLGIGLALDDFGTGFASLSMLKRLPLTVMKLDRLLVRELPTSREDAAIVQGVIETGRAMRLTTVAEGIETEAQRAYLSGIGCNEGQGYLFSHPVPAGQLRPKLDSACS
jgi:EAL domain-containing protein (putative c-di-GMP-specific phosphodiesterase class I)